MSLLLVAVSGWTLWHDVGIYEAGGPTHLGGPTYAVSSFRTEADCHAGQREAMVNEELPRRGPLTERLPDGVLVWDASGHHYTTFRYRCAPTGVPTRPMSPSR